MNSPWHTCVHGIGLGGRPARFDHNRSDAAVLQRLSRKYVRHAREEPYARWSDILARAAIASTSRPTALHHVLSELQSLWHKLDWPVTRAMGCALALNVLSRMPVWTGRSMWLDIAAEACLKESIDALACSGNDKERYAIAMGMVTLIDALTCTGRGGLLLQRPDGFAPIESLLHEISGLNSHFLRGRSLATLLAALDPQALAPEARAQFRAALLREMRELDRASTDPASALDDGIHTRHDHVLFPLALLLTGAAHVEPLMEGVRLDGAASLMQRLYEHSTLSSRASQWTFCSLALLHLERIDRRQALERTLNLASVYAEAGHAMHADGYLRCCYLLTTAEALGGRAQLSAELEAPLRRPLKADASTTASGLAPKYQRQAMWSAYALFASSRSSWSLDLAQTCESLEEAWTSTPVIWDNEACMVFGHALVDTALDLKENTL